MATNESATGRPMVEFEEIDTDEVLDGLDFEDEGEGPANQGDTPAEQAPARNQGEPPANTEPGVESAAEGGPAGNEPASRPEASTAPSEDTTPAGTDGARPFTFSVDRQEVQVEGAFVVPPAPGEENGEPMIVMPLATFQRQLLPNYIGNRQTFQRTVRAKDMEIAELRESRTARETEAETLLTHLNELYEDPDRLTAFLQNFNAEAPEIRAKAENARLQAELDEVKRGRLSPEQRIEQEERAEAEAAQGLEGWVQTLADPAKLASLIGPEVAEEFKGVKLDLAGIYQMLMAPELKGAVFVTAQDDNPATGAKKGELAVNLGVVLNLMRREAALARRFGTETRQVAEVARGNAAAVGGSARKQHPATAAAAGTGTITRPQREEPKTRAEWLKSLDDDD